jgi:Bifunctional DNA primase/polymerase, N-terminal
MNDHLEWALAYADRLGWLVHPCRAVRPGGDKVDRKKPAIKKWHERATTNPAQIRHWWRAYPDSSIAIATGSRSGIWVLDVDGAEGLESLRRRPDLLAIETATQRTGSGGMQLFFQWPAGRTIRNSCRKLGPGLDVRGEGGYVVAPPSVHPNDQLYEWIRDPEAIAPAPGWLVEAIDPPKPQPAAPPPWRAPAGPATRAYLERAIESELEAVAYAPPHTANDQLNRSAHALFRFAVSGQVPPTARLRCSPRRGTGGSLTARRWRRSALPPRRGGWRCEHLGRETGGVRRGGR